MRWLLVFCKSVLDTCVYAGFTCEINLLNTKSLKSYTIETTKNDVSLVSVKSFKSSK